jgi:hypothetical protein
MVLSIRQIAEESKLCHEVNVDMITDLFPVELVLQILQEDQILEERERRLNLCMLVYTLIGWGLYADLPLHEVPGQLTHGARLIWPDGREKVPVPSAFTYRRKQLTSLPLVRLMERCCQPLADESTPGAFRFGLRLMALDSTIENVPDAKGLGAVFGRLAGRKGQSAFPQIQGTYLVECGTHAIVDALFLPCRVNERHAAKVLLHRKVGPGMLVQWDTGFHEFDLFRLTRHQGGEALGRLPAGPCPQKLKQLSDGSWLVEIQPGDIKRRRKGEKLLLRMVEYTLTDPNLPGYQGKHRLLTTILDEQLAPAIELVCCYHERWEVEIVIDEVDTHQRSLTPVLRSKRADLIYQELYGILLAHYLIRRLMLQCAQERGEDPDRLSFAHAVHIIRQYVPSLQMLDPASWPALQKRMRQEIAAVCLPQRHLRINARVVKRKYSPFDLKRPEHCHPPRFSQEIQFRDLVLLI